MDDLTIEEAVGVVPDGDAAFSSRALWKSPGARGVFGGLVIAQALSAACATVAADWRPHALHSMFLLAVQPEPALVFRVERLRDGRAYAARRVTALQGGACVYVGQYSFVHGAEDGLLDHQLEPPAAASLAVSEMATLGELAAAARAQGHAGLAAAVSRRPVLHSDVALRVAPLADYGALVRPPLPQPMSLAPDDAAAYTQSYAFCVPRAMDGAPLSTHLAVAAYVSDQMLLATALRPAGLHMWSAHVAFLATLDHCVWIHRAFRVDAPRGERWLRCVLESPRAHGGRGFATARVYAPGEMLVGGLPAEGALVHVMTCVQEGALRIHSDSRI